MALRSRLRAIPWLVLWETARAVRYNASARVEDNLTGRERNHFRDLLRKSRGRRSNLSERERARLVLLFKKAVTGDAHSEWGQVARALPELIPREALAQYWEHRRRHT